MDIDDLLRSSNEPLEFEFKEAYWQKASLMIDQHYRRKMVLKWSYLVLGFALVFTMAYLALTKSDLKGRTMESKEIASGFDTDSYALDSYLNGLEVPLIKNAEQNNIGRNLEEQKVEKMAVEGLPRSSEYNNANIKTATLTDGFKNKVNHASVTESSKSVPKLETEPVQESLPFEGENINQLYSGKQIEKLTGWDVMEDLNEKLAVSGEYYKVDSDCSFLGLPFEVTGPETAGPIRLSLVSNSLDSKRARKWHNFVSAGVLTYPKFGSTSRSLIGLNAGMEFRYTFAGSYFIGSGLTARYRTGSFKPAIYSTQTNYLFGPSSDAYTLTPSSLFTIIAPLKVGGSIRTFDFSIGASLHYLAAVFGELSLERQLNPANEFPSGNIPSELIAKGWMSRQGLREFTISYHLDVSKWIHPRYALGVQLQYLPSDWLSENYGSYFDPNAGRFVYSDRFLQGLIEKNWLMSFYLIHRL